MAATRTAGSSRAYSSPIATASPVAPSEVAPIEQERNLEVRCPTYEQSVFANAVFSFHKSQWKIQQHLSSVDLQRTCSPCEARQTFHAICVKSSSGTYSVGKEATVKIKFQVLATEETVDLYQYYIDEHKADLIRHPTRADEIQEAIARTQRGLPKCTEPTRKPDEDTLNELAALHHLTEKECCSTPWLLDIVRENMDSKSPKVHRRAVAGGFMVAILMSSLPGWPLDEDYLSSLTLSERESLRKDFKIALLDVLKCGIECRETGLHNLKWDKNEHKCYIIDLEHSVFASEEAQQKLEFDDDEEYESWGLMEGYYV